MSVKLRSCLYDIPLYVPGKSVLSGIEKPLKLSSNESPYGASPMALEAYKKAIDNMAQYPDGNATTLKETLAKTYQVPMKNIICGAGSDNILELLSLAFMEAGDEGIFTQNTFPIYNIAIRTAGGVPITVPYKEDYTHDLDAIVKACTSKTKIIYLASPDNPTGTYIPKEKLERFIKQIPSHILIVIDEAYYEYVKDDAYLTALSIAPLYPNIVVTRTFSKLFGLAALRVGWAYGAHNIIEGLNRIRSPFNVSIPAQYAACAALEDQDWQRDSIDKTVTLRTQFQEFLSHKKIDFVPSGANFVFMRFEDADHVDQSLKEQGIIIRNMKTNHFHHHLRISVGTQENMQRLISVMDTIL